MVRAYHNGFRTAYGARCSATTAAGAAGTASRHGGTGARYAVSNMIYAAVDGYVPCLRMAERSFATAPRPGKGQSREIYGPLHSMNSSRLAQTRRRAVGCLYAARSPAVRASFWKRSPSAAYTASGLCWRRSVGHRMQRRGAQGKLNRFSFGVPPAAGTVLERRLGPFSQQRATRAHLETEALRVNQSLVYFGCA